MENRSDTPSSRDLPTRPDHSLPSYAEPTPETHRRISREKEAEIALTTTRITRGVCNVVLAGFFLTIASVSLLQFGSGIGSSLTQNQWFFQRATHLLPEGLRLADLSSPRKFLIVPKVRGTMQIEKALEEQSVVSKGLLPWAQLGMSYFHAGNEQVYFGSKGWLFYRADVDYVTSKPFLAGPQLATRIRREAVQPDPVCAIVDFRNQLRLRGIDLVVVPVPVKPSIETEAICGRAFENPVQNTSFNEFTRRLSCAGVRLFDVGTELTRRKGSDRSRHLYLKTDTHWRPETMEYVANRLAQFLGSPYQRTNKSYTIQEGVISGSGDVALMLKLPPKHKVFPEETVKIHRVFYDGQPWRPNEASDILLLGDSFSNIYSFDKMGWGENAGFSEQLSLALGEPPIDRIVRNSDGAFATREMLAQELGHGHDRLAGKKVVIWEFAARELSFGNWKMIGLKPPHVPAARFFQPPIGQRAIVSGIVGSISAVPAPGRVPYPDHIMCIHLINLTDGVHAGSLPTEAVVYLWSMRNNTLTKAARLTPREHIRISISRWSDISSQYETFNRSELDDPALQLAEPVWGELLE